MKAPESLSITSA